MKSSVFIHDFTAEEIKILNEYRDKEEKTRLKLRFISLIFLASKTDIEVVASSVGYTVFTIENWYSQYISEGIESLSCLKYTHKQSFLNFFQINQTVIYVKFENPGTLEQIKTYIKEKFGVEYSVEGVRKLLKKHGIKLIRPKIHPGNPPTVEEQYAFIKKYNEQKQTDPPCSVRLFGDAMHLIHQNIPEHCWGDPGFPPVMGTNTGRKRLNIFGIYNPDTFSFSHLTGEENCNADRFIEFLKIILKTNSYAPKITLYVDNAKYFHSAKVSEWIKDNPKIQLDFLPAYSPNLNLIERFWKYAKKHLVKNKYYKEYRIFRAKVFQFLNNVNDHIDKLKTLMVEKFQIINV
jgi:transposase